MNQALTLAAVLEMAMGVILTIDPASIGKMGVMIIAVSCLCGPTHRAWRSAAPSVPALDRPASRSSIPVVD
jgi:hypothetical protein